MKYIIYCLAIINIAFSYGCKKTLSTEPESGNNQWNICYVKTIGNNWEVVINNKGTIKNISNNAYEDNYPQWSPDGKYIVYQHFSSSSSDIYLYDVEKDTSINLTPDEIYDAASPRWTPDGEKIFFNYHEIGNDEVVYIMNKDGSSKRKIADTRSYVYFCNDNFTFLYKKDSEIYKTDLDGSFNDFVLNLEPEENKYITVRDFNINFECFLANTNFISEYNRALVKYDIETKTFYTIYGVEKGYVSLSRCSKDFTKIAFYEEDVNSSQSYLVLLENGQKTNLFSFGEGESLDFNPMQFSQDGNYLAFSKDVIQDGYWYSWISYLYVADIKTGKTYYIDEGINPTWDPQGY